MPVATPPLTSSTIEPSTITLTGDASGSVAYDGSEDVSLEVTIIPGSKSIGNVRDSLKSGETVSIYCVGDSITYGQLDTSGRATTPYPARLQEYLREYDNDELATITNTGVSGRQSSAILNNLQTEVIDNDPDLVIYNAGTNDSREANNVTVSQFRENVDATLQMLADNDIPVIVLGITPRAKENLSENGEKRRYLMADELHAAAAQAGAPYIDTYSDLMDIYKSGGHGWKEVSSDGSHYSQKGYDLIAGSVFRAIFAYEDIALKAGQKMPLWSQILEQDLASDASYSVTGDYDEAIKLTAEVRIWFWYVGREADLVIHTTIDNSNNTTQSVVVVNTSITGATGSTYSLSPPTTTTAGTYYISGYPIVTEKVVPGLNIITLAPGDIDCRLEAISILEHNASYYMMPSVDDEINDTAGEIHTAAVLHQSDDASKALLSSPVVLSGVIKPREIVSTIFPSGRGQTYRLRIRGTLTKDTTIMFGQKIDDSGPDLAWQLDFGFTNFELKAYARSATQVLVSTPRTTVFPSGWDNAGTDVYIDIKSTPSGFALWINSYPFAVVTVPLGIGPIVVVQTQTTGVRIIIDQVYERGPACADTDNDACEQWIDWSASPPVKKIVSGDGATVYSVTPV